MRTAAVMFLATLASSWIPKDKAVWEAKPYDSWSRTECERVLMDSPWSVRYVVGEYDINNTRFGTDGGLGTSTRADPAVLAGGERKIELTFLFSILSARPIRMALTRLSAIESPGAIDGAGMRRQAEDPIPGVILVRIDYTVEPKGHPAIRDFELFFQQASFGLFSNTTWLSGGRTRVPIARYMGPGPQNPRPVFVFPRMDQHGQPFFSDTMKSLYLETQIDLRKLGGRESFDMRVKFDLSKMLFAGKLEL